MLDIRDAINDFCLSEYDCLGDFTDPEQVSFLYTTVSRDNLDDETANYLDDLHNLDEFDLQITIDIVHKRVIFRLGDERDNNLVHVDDYEDLQTLAEEIEDTDFNDWYSYAIQLF